MGGYVHGNMQRSKYCKTKLLPQIPNPWTMSQSMDTWKKNLKKIIMQHNVFPEIKQLWKQFYDLERELNKKLEKFRFLFDTCNPVVYAAEIHCNYLQQYLDSPKRILFVGMNPGRYGALQTSIPFGNITTVKRGMRLRGRITPTPGQRGNIWLRDLETPEEEGDSSSTRFWRLISELFDGAENYLELFFEKCFVHNFCPLVFIDRKGHNVSLPYIGPNLRLFAECRKTLGKQITLLKPDLIICIGQFVRSMLSKTRQAKGREILMIEHPSYKKNTSADKWIRDAKKVFRSNGLFWEIIRGST
ncbi:single-strand selective monofunctional uracil DNA glycosylase-like [Musca autumnalis]|uniref:single-strand selective monofunctional uracil DNA glycosylase-like n=1 Tax=Musca autumnalis TaxID=221902 RepID=UPI003CE76574